MSESQVRQSFAKERTVVYLMTFIMGGCGIAYEYTFSKLSADLLGNSVHQWAITIGLMMFFMGIGSDLQKHLQDKGLFDRFIFFEILLGIIGGFGPILLVFTFGFFRDHYVALQYFCTISVGFLIGLEIPILTRLNEKYAPELRVNIGGVLRMDYVGAFCGALVWVFILPRFFSLTQMSFVLGLFNLVTAGLALVFFHHLALRKVALYGLVAAGCLAMIIGFSAAPVWTSHAEQGLYQDKIIHSETTRYQHIVLTEAISGDVHCFINGNTQFASYDEHIYHEFLVHPAMLIAPRRKKILVLGGGDGLAVREILKYPDVESVTLVDLDPGMTRLASQHPAVTKLNRNSLSNAKVSIVEHGALVEDPDEPKVDVYITDENQAYGRDAYAMAKVNLIHLDASLFVEQISGSYDVIIIDFPDPNKLELSKLYSLGFYRNLQRKLSRDGVMVQQSGSPVHTKEAYLCIGRTLAAAGFEVVPLHDNVPSFGEWGWWIAVRGDAVLAPRLKQAIGEIENIPVPVRYLTPEVIDASLIFAKDQLSSRQEEINTILNNVVFRFYEDP